MIFKLATIILSNLLKFGVRKYPWTLIFNYFIVFEPGKSWRWYRYNNEF